MSPANWFYGREGVQHGPVGEDELRRLVDSGLLGPHDLVWRDGMPAWQPAQDVPGLLDVVALGPPPLPDPAAPRLGIARHAPGGTIGYARPAEYQPPPPGPGDNAGMRMLLPVGRSGWAIAAGYCGLLSLFCWLLGPAAILCGVMAIRDMRLHPERHGMGRVVTGFVLGGLGTLILSFYGAAVMARLLR